MWTAPWTVRQELKRQSDEQNRIYYEPRCHEGNYGLPALLIGARVDEQAFAEGRGPRPVLARHRHVRDGPAGTERSRPCAGSGPKAAAGRAATQARPATRAGSPPGASMMGNRFRISTVVTVLAAFSIGAVVAVGGDRLGQPGPGPVGAAGADARRTPELQRRVAGPQRGALGPAGPRGAAGHGDAGGRLSLRVRPGAGGPGGGAGRRGRRAGVDGGRAGRRHHPLHARGAPDQGGERRELDRPRPRAEVLPAGHAAGDVHALSVPDRAGRRQDPHELRLLERGPRHPSRRGRPAARLDLHGALARPVGRRPPWWSR